MTGTTKAWLGRFGEVGHPYTHPSTKQCNYTYTHPSTKQCNYSVDTSLFATKEYVDGKVGGITGVVKVIDNIISNAATSSNYILTVTTTYDLSDIGFDVYKILVTDSIASDTTISLPYVGLVYGANHPYTIVPMYGFGTERELVNGTSIATSVYDFTLNGNIVHISRQIELQNNILSFRFIAQSKWTGARASLEKSFTWPQLTIKCFA